MRGTWQDLTNKIFGKWTVIEFSHRGKYGDSHWLCRCNCGTKQIIFGGNLRSGKTTQCVNCKKIEAKKNPYAFKHGMSKTNTYRIWYGMKERCYNTKNEKYKDYGGRGISVCDNWKNSFENFYTDMGERPRGLSIDRINNNGNYEPSNCRWATPTQQMKNTRRAPQPDEFTCLEGKASHQRIAQLRRKKAGLCAACKSPLNLSTTLCDKHFLERSKKQGIKHPFKTLLRLAENKGKSVAL
jgi:hypothetical protein